MESPYTPGPWIINAGYMVGASDPENAETIAVFEARPGEANARLIAAAPDLLAALDQLLAATVDAMANEGYELSDEEAAARAVALAAIAKATGAA